jgi:hypothetical protein
MESWPDQIAERVNCFDLQHWLPGLAHWLGLETAALLPLDARRKWLVTSPERGVELQFRHPHAGFSEVADVSRWIFVSVRFVQAADLPFGLDRRYETLESAKRKLTSQTEGTLPRVSFFLTDDRVVELSYRKDGHIDDVWVVRLGRELSWNSIA